MKKVAVEDNLSEIAGALKDHGYTIVSTKSKESVVATIVTGMDNNIMNIQNATTKSPVIDATGMTPNQVLSRIEALS